MKYFSILYSYSVATLGYLENPEIHLTPKHQIFSVLTSRLLFLTEVKVFQPYSS